MYAFYLGTLSCITLLDIYWEPKKRLLYENNFPNRERRVVRANFQEEVKFSKISFDGYNYGSVKRVGGHFVNVWGADSEQVGGGRV